MKAVYIALTYHHFQAKEFLVRFILFFTLREVVMYIAGYVEITPVLRNVEDLPKDKSVPNNVERYYG